MVLGPLAQLGRAVDS